MLVAFAASIASAACAFLVTVGDEYSRDYCEGALCDGGRAADGGPVGDAGEDGAAIVGGDSSLEWEELRPEHSPDRRYQFAMAWDPARGTVVLFGGYQQVDIADTWVWDGKNDWLSVRTGDSGPPPRRQGAFAFHPNSKLVVLFAGTSNEFTARADTWTWNGSYWNGPIFPSLRPLFRFGAPMAATSDGNTIIFGGTVTDGGALGLGDDTWQWDGVTWSDLRPSPHPPAMSGAAMAYDPERRETVLFGGGMALPSDNAPTSPSDETWIWKKAGATFAWSKATPSAKPSPRLNHTMAYHPGRASIILYGGTGPANVPLDDTWEWTGTTWVPLDVAVKPLARGYHGMAQGWRDGGILLFGGADLVERAGTTAYFDDSWKLP